MIRNWPFSLPRLVAGVGLVPFTPRRPRSAQRRPGEYVNKGSRPDSAGHAHLAQLPNLEGKWYVAGPFDNSDRAGSTSPIHRKRRSI